MVNALFLPVAVVYVAVVAVLAIYGLNYWYLTFLAWVRRDQHPTPPPLTSVPNVAVQLPIYNEPYVVERVIYAAGRLDYPAERLQIQVLDDSTDETTALASRAVARLRRQGMDVVLIHRKNRQGFKAGALAEGLARTNAEFIAIFDADFVPPPDFLRRTLPHFQDPRIAFVQTRWGHVNRNSSTLTLLQSLGLDAHFMVEQFARSMAGYWFNFNGSGGVWRRTALEDAGGWSSDTLTEDLDLSYRAFLRGWRARYLREVEVPAELPASFSAYRRQQHRWAMGSLECAVKLIPQIWKSKAPLSRKLEGTLHLSGYAVHLALFALVLLYPVVLMLAPRDPGLISLFGMGALFSLAAFAPTLFLMFAQHELGRRWWLLLPGIILTTALGAGMMLNTVRAGVQLLLGQRISFERTPKSGAVGRNLNEADHHSLLPVDGIIVFELALAALNLGTVVFALRTHNWMVASYACLYSLGLLFTPLWTISQALSARGRAAHTPTPPTTARA
jgi:cellulose synthase/poly-beta-1,6-N-acetylglucosamine synthase-like glycosyltransferase